MKKILISLIVGVLLTVAADRFFVLRSRIGEAEVICGIVPPCFTYRPESSRWGLPFATRRINNYGALTDMSTKPKALLPGWALNVIFYAGSAYVVMLFVQKKKHAHHRH